MLSNHMGFLRHIIGLLAVLLFSALSAVAMPMMPTASDHAEFFPLQQTVTAEQIDVHFAARGPPLAATNVAFTGADVVGYGDGIVIHGHAIHVARLSFGADFDAPNRTLALPAPEYKAPSGYNVTVNSNGSATVTGPRGATYNSTGRYSADGKPIYRNEGGGYVTLDGGRVDVRAPTDYTSVPVHHVCTNKCNVGTGGNPAWTPRFQRIFDNAGLNIDGEINKIAVPGHRGPHPQAYHQHVY